VKYRIVFATAKSKAHAKLVREPLLLNLTPMKRTVQEDVEATVSPLNDFESRGRFLSRAESLRVLLTSHLVDDGTASFMSTGSFTAGLHPNRGCVIGYTALGNLLSDKNENSATLVVKYRIPEGALFSISVAQPRRFPRKQQRYHLGLFTLGSSPRAERYSIANTAYTVASRLTWCGSMARDCASAFAAFIAIIGIGLGNDGADIWLLT
jgi:hypothetical protein